MERRDWGIDPQQVAADLIDLIQIPSVGGSAAEIQIQQSLAARWRDEGLAVTTTEVDPADLQTHRDYPGNEVARKLLVNVVARLPGTGGGRSLLLLGHTDVVPARDERRWQQAPFAPAVSDGPTGTRIIGRGSADMKSGMVAAWSAIRAVRERQVPLAGDVYLAAVSGEEDGGSGTFALLQSGVRADACVIPEPTDLNIVTANAGALSFRLRVMGKPAHAARRSDGVSAVTKFFPIQAALADLERRRNQQVSVLLADWPIAYPISIGTVRAGDWSSTVPAELTAEGRFGVALGESLANAKAEFEAAVASASAADEWLRDHPVTVEWWGGQFAPASTDPDEAIVQQLSARHADSWGSQPRIRGAAYGSDLRLLVNFADIPTVLYGPGSSDEAHATDESVALADVVTCAEVLADTIVAWCR